MLDIDHFKKINDSYGHPAGDYVLAEVSRLIQTKIRAEDILARFGGEEFSLILREQSAGEAALVCERIRQSIESREFLHNGTTISLTISIGVATLESDNYSSWNAFVQAADDALYRAKREGRNRVVSH